jgi:hypothetical protein
MAATVHIICYYGAGPSSSNIESTNLRHQTYDAVSTNDTTYPIQIPAAGTNYSYWKTTRLSAAVTPVGTINNIKWYNNLAGTPFGTNITMQVGQVTQANGSTSAYVQATGTPGITGTLLSSGNYSGYAVGNVDASVYTSSAMYSITGSISNSNTGDFGNLIVTQINVPSTVTQTGASGAPTITIQWDET